MSLSISISGGKLQADLRRLVAHMQGAGRAKVLKAGGHAIAAMATRAFRDESLRPSPWLPLAKKTLAKKAAGRTSPLIDTGALFRSIRVAQPEGDSVEIASDRPYATYHQFGTTRMPARPFIPAIGGEDGGAAALTPAAEESVKAAMAAQAKAETRAR